jgi:succinoglycan biosynthesis transport protein ExoP
MREPVNRQPQGGDRRKTPASPAKTTDAIVGAIGLPIGRVFRAVRRHLVLAAFLASLTATGVLVALQETPRYRATATLRLAGERRQLSAGMEEAAAPIDRSSAPLLSLVPRVRSRAVIGRVVDSLNLQLGWVPIPTGTFGTKEQEPVIPLDSAGVDRAAGADTLRLIFSENFFKVRQGERELAAPYGKRVSVGAVRFAIGGPPDLPVAALAVQPRDRAIDQVLDQLAVVPVTGTDALEVRYTDTNPARAQQVANTVAESFYLGTINSSQQQARRRRAFLEGQLQETERELNKAQTRLAGFRRRQQEASSTDKIAMQQAALMALDTRRSEVEADLRVYRSLLEQIESVGDGADRTEALRGLAYYPEIAADESVSRVYQQMLTHRSRLDSLTTGPWRSSETNPDVVQLRQLVAASEQELLFALRARLRALEGRRRALAEIRTSSVDSLRAMPILEAEESYLGEQVVSLNAVTSQLRLEYQKARMAEELEAGDVEIVDLAALPYTPVGVPFWFKFALAAALGIMVGAAGATLIDSRNRSIRDPEELAELLPVRGLGIIPRVEEARLSGSGRVLRALGSGNGHAAANGLPHEVVKDSPFPSVGGEAFRLLYTSLTFGWGDVQQRTILVTSTAPREGKTFVATNLAVTFAREGARVLLIDCDLRRPRLHQVFHVPRSPGLMDLIVRRPASPPAPPVAPAQVGMVERPTHRYSILGLVGADDVASDVPSAMREPAPARPAAPTSAPVTTGDWPRAIRRTSIQRLNLLTCGTLPENPAECLKTAELRRVLDGLRDSFDLIVIDTPPVLVSADAPILAPLVDGVLLVVRAGQTEAEPAMRAYEQLAAAGAPILGTVLNDPEEEVARYRTLYYTYDYPSGPA